VDHEMGDGGMCAAWSEDTKSVMFVRKLWSQRIKLTTLAKTRLIMKANLFPRSCSNSSNCPPF
jgi:hypothetical protein